MHNERFVAVELYCLLQDRRRRAVLNLQSTGARKSDLRRLWERFVVEKSVVQPTFQAHYYVEIQDIIINLNGLFGNIL